LLDLNVDFEIIVNFVKEIGAKNESY